MALAITSTEPIFASQRCCLVARPAPGKAAEPERSSHAFLCRSGSGQPWHRNGQCTHGHHVPNNSRHRPPASDGPLVPCFGHAEGMDMYTQRARGTLTFTLNICCYSQSAGIMRKTRKKRLIKEQTYIHHVHKHIC